MESTAAGRIIGQMRETVLRAVVFGQRFRQSVPKWLKKLAATLP
jgi:hypothetical protein